MKDLLLEISSRKLEMVKESQNLGRAEQQLTSQLQQVRLKKLELETELKVLDKWEAKFKEK